MAESRSLRSMTRRRQRVAACSSRLQTRRFAVTAQQVKVSFDLLPQVLGGRKGQFIYLYFNIFLSFSGEVEPAKDTCCWSQKSFRQALGKGRRQKQLCMKTVLNLCTCLCFTKGAGGKVSQPPAVPHGCIILPSNTDLQSKRSCRIL